MTPVATKFYYEAHVFTDRAGKDHFTFQVPHALGPRLAFRSYSRPAIKRPWTRLSIPQWLSAGRLSTSVRYRIP
jgi:hypothetical protein